MIETIINTNCDWFDNMFEGDRKEIVIRDADSLVELEKALNTKSWAQSTPDINVRIKVFVEYKAGGQAIICMDAFKHILVNGRLINHNKALVHCIWPLIEAGLKQQNYHALDN